MKVRFTKKVGDVNFEIEEEAKDEKALFGVVEFWSSLPTAHPSGATDLRFAHRQAKNQDDKTINFYEIVCESKGQRFCFGQRAEGGGLFPKGWQDVYHDGKENNDDHRHVERQASRTNESPSVKNGNLDGEIRMQLTRLGAVSPGAEKTLIMKALNSKVGLLATELDLTEKSDLLEALRGMQSAQGRAA